MLEDPSPSSIEIQASSEREREQLLCIYRQREYIFLLTIQYEFFWIARMRLSQLELEHHWQQIHCDNFELLWLQEHMCA